MFICLTVEVLILLPLVLITWNFIHEGSHLLAASYFGKGLKEYKIKPYPHRYKDGFRFAGCYWTSNEKISTRNRAFVSLAPRVADLLAVLFLLLLAPLHSIISIFIFIPLVMLFGAGLVDFFVGSIGNSPNSDLARAAKGLNISEQYIRIPGFSIITLTVLLFFIILFV